MTSSPEETEIIEHVVLFNIKDDEDSYQDTTLVNDMVNGLNNLNALSSVVYLTAGPILRTRSSPLRFTHMLHARYRTVSDLNSYSLDPAHVSVVDNLVRPICEDVMAVDWSANLGADNPFVVPRPGSAIRFIFFQVEGDKEKEAIFGSMEKLKESLGPYEQISFGDNFSERGKGYSVGSLVVFPDLNELDACEEYEDQMRSLVGKVKGSLDGMIVVDYLVPRHANVSASTE